MIRPLPHISGYFWIHNFFFPDTASVHTYLVNPVYKSATFWIHSPEWKFLKTLWVRKRFDVKTGYFLSGDVTRSSPVLYCEYCTSLPGSLKAEQDANFAPTFPGVLVKSESGYVWTGKFDLNTDCVFSHDVMAAVFVSRNNETAAMLIGVPNHSCGSWILFLCKRFLLFQ